MTSLAQQLQRLAVPEARAAAAIQRKERKSLLFEPAEAAGLDRDTFYAIGVNGLQELLGIDPRFQEFDALLFDEASKLLERSTQTREVNDKLDKKIRRFLLTVSPYFLLKPAQKAMEWLVHRFQIHEYNKDELLMCVLPYHETKVFVRAVQLLNIRDKKQKWNWLEPIQKPGVSLSRLALVTHCISDGGFLHFVCELPVLAIKAHKKTWASLDSDHPASDAPLRVVFSFYATTIVSAIATLPRMKESFLGALVPFLLRGLKQDFPDYNGATYMIICQLGVSANLKNSLLEPLMEAMCQYARPGMLQQMLGCLAVLCRTQALTQLPGKVLFQLCAMPQFLIPLTQLSQSHNVTPLLTALLPQLTATAVQAEASGRDSLPEGCEEVDFMAILAGILRDIQVESQIVVTTARCLLHEFVSACCRGLDEEKRNGLKDQLCPVVQGLERRFPEAMDLILESYLTEVEDEKRQRFVQEFISLSAGSTKHQLLPESNTSLVLSLNHASPEVRRLAVNHIKDLIKQGVEVDSFLQESLLQRLQDDSMLVTAAVIQLGEDLCEILPTEPMFAALKKHINKWKRGRGTDRNQVMMGALKIITSRAFLSRTPQLEGEVVAMAIPHLLTTTPLNAEVEREMGALLGGSYLVQTHPALKGIKAALTTKKPSDEKQATAQLLNLLGKNIAALASKKQDELIAAFISHLHFSSKPEAYSAILTVVLLRVLQHTKDLDTKLDISRKLLELLEGDAKKACRKDVRLTGGKQREGAEEMGKLDDALQPVADPLDNLPPNLHNHLSALLTMKNKHKLATVAYLHASQVQTMLWALDSLVLSLTPLVPSMMPDSKWWVSGQDTDDIRGQYVTFVLRLVDLLTQGSADCKLKGGPKQAFRGILQKVIKNLFIDSTDFLKLASIGWISHVTSSQPMGFKPSPVFQVRCLNMAAVIMGSMDKEDVCAVVEKESTVLPCLLMALACPLEPVREVALHCLQTVKDCCHDNDSSPYYWLVQRLLKKRESLALDAGYIKFVLGSLLMKANNADVAENPPKKRKGAGKSPDEKADTATQAKGCLNQLLDCITADGIPQHAQKYLLSLLEQVDSEIVLSSLLGMLSELLTQAYLDEGSLSADQMHSLRCIMGHVTPLTANLMGDQRCLGLMLEALSREEPVCVGMESPLQLAVQQMTGAFYAALPSPNVQQTLLSKLIDLQVDSQSSATASRIGKVVRKLPVSAAQFVAELSKIVSTQKPKSVKDARKARQKQKQASTEESSGPSTSDDRPWQRVTAILEILQQKKIGKIDDVHLIVPTLFTILNLCLELPRSEQGSNEYIKQLLLTTILSICDHLDVKEEETTAGKLTEEQFSVELVVQCIRTSDNPQTHNHALLLLATAAKLFPEHVLHNVMAIFTFMGARLLRQDDSHSFQIIHRTVQTVIPALVKASKDQALPSSLAGSLEDVVTMVMQTFVDAFPHIPEHRRLPLFTHLVQSVGGAEYLWRVVMLLVGGYATKGAVAMLPEETETKGPGRNLEFWLALSHRFGPEIQVISLIRMLAYLGTLKEKKEEGTKTPARSSRSLRSTGPSQGSKVTPPDLIFDVQLHSARQLRQFKFTAVGFVSQLLTSDTFIGQLVNLSDAESSEMQALYQMLLEQTLCYITHVAHCIQANTDPLTAKFWRALLHKAYDVLDKVNSLLPARVFIRVVSGLLGNRLPTIRRKAMELLNNKLIQHKEGFDEEEVSMLLGMVDVLISIAKPSRGDQSESEELDINRQTALYSLKLLCKLFGGDHRKEFVKVMDLSLDVIGETQKNNQVIASGLMCLAEAVNKICYYIEVIASGLLCLAEAVNSLRAHAIPYLSRFMPLLLDSLASKTQVTSSDLHLVSTVTAVQKVLENLPHFISPYLSQLLQEVCRLSASRQEEEKAQLTLRLKACRHQLAIAPPPRVLIPTLAECYQAVVSTHQSSIGPLMSILSDHLDHLAKEDLLSHHHAMVSLFLTALDYRSTHPEASLDNVSNIEGHVIDGLITMVMKLSEATFRPMFLKLFEWATRTSNPDRLLTFYRLSDKVAEKLKSLFCLFAGHLVSNVAQILDANNVIKTDEPFFSESDSTSEEKSSLLLGYSLDCLQKCFLYDKGDFVSKERFEKLMQPLVDQIENTQGGDDVYRDRVASHLTPCIVQFMVAARDPSTWQPLNYQVLLKTRNSSPMVRYAALSILQSLHTQLGEDYLSLLPETIPFLAELMEDESEEVEQHCQDVVAELEKTLGEPLQKYF